MSTEHRRRMNTKSTPKAAAVPAPGPDSLLEIDRAPAHELVVRILDRLLYIVLPVTGVALAAALWRSFALGWSLLAVLHSLLAASAAVLLLLRGRLPSRVLLWGCAAALVLNGLINLTFMGLAGLGLLAFSSAAVFLGVSFGGRAGIAATLALLVLGAGLGLAASQGLLPVNPPAAGYLDAPTTWLSQLTGFCLYTSLSVTCIAAVREGLWRQTRQLAQANADLRRAEGALGERERRYRLLAENMQDVLFVQDTDLNITYVSPSVQTLMGYTPEETARLRPEDYLVPASLPRFYQSVTDYLPLLKSGELTTPPLMEYEYRRKDGSTFFGELRLSLLRDDEEQVVACQGILRDVTERHQAEQDKTMLQEQLRRSEQLRAIGELAGGVAHDFNNQLAAILGSAELLRRQLDDASPLASYVDQILTATQRAADLTSNLLAFARRGRFRSVVVDLNELTEEVAAILQRSIDRSIVVRRDSAPGPLVVRGDPSQIQSALLNIALNARDAMPQGGVLTFRTAAVELDQALAQRSGLRLEPGHYVQVVVADQGEGMARETMQRIFEPFFTTKEAGRGTGMGLAATYGTVEAHGGVIDVQSGEGEGSVFTIYLPAWTDQEPGVEPGPPRSATSPAPASAAGPGPTSPAAGMALVVEDEPLVLRNLEQMLEQLGYRVETCSRGDQAVERFRALRSAPDVVLLDMNLPGMSGRRVFEQLRQLTPELPVLICSGYSLEDDVRELLEQGNVARLQKPFKLAELEQALQDARCRRSAADSARLQARAPG